MRSSGRAARAAFHLAIYLVASGIAASLLLLVYQRWTLVAFGAVASVALVIQLILRQHRLDRTWTSRLVAIAALSVTGPAAYYAATGMVDRRAMAVWVLAFLYSAASVFFVRMIYRPPRKRRASEIAGGRTEAQRNMLIYLGVAALVVLGLSAAGWLPPLGPLALLPLAVKVGRATRRQEHQTSLKEIGLAELWHTALFALLAITTIGLW